MLRRVFKVNISLNNPSEEEGRVFGSFQPLSTSFLVYADTTVKCVNSKPAATAEPDQHIGEDLWVGVSRHKGCKYF